MLATLWERSPTMSAGVLRLDLSLETPENVVLTHELAGPGRRCVAYLIDYALRWFCFLVALIPALFFAVAMPGVTAGTLFLLVFLLEWGYSIGFEYVWVGRTPGKWICGLRVIHENGQPLSWWGAGLRNLVRVADTVPMLFLYPDGGLLMAILPIYGPGLICMTLTSRLQRLGDLAARTVVIHERRTALPRNPVIYDHIPRLPVEHRPRTPPRSETLALIDEFLSRRSVLTYERGHDLAAGLAVALATQWNYAGDWDQVRNYPMAFLGRVYKTYAIPEENEPVAQAVHRVRRAPAEVVR
ncbi:MAG TPA: RDD family protein [Planctomycetaceae bacterium]|nr:RDD family protein [Planctomycetaceae bacterium]